MSATLLRDLRIGIAVWGAWTGALALYADNPHDYPETGTVIASTVDHGFVYTIETGDKVYQMVCMAGSIFHPYSQPCTSGGRPIVVHDTVRFRVDGDIAHMPGSGDAEEKLLILTTELKILPPLPASTTAVGDCGAVLGVGVEIHDVQTTVRTTALPMPPHPASSGSSSIGPATPSGTTPVIASAPVTAIPVTGGPPVQVIPTGPVNGGPVTGVPVTGGRPVVAVPIGPVTGTPVASASSLPSSSPPAATPPASSSTVVDERTWVHFLRIQTAGRVYDLACPSKSCSLKDRPIQLGDVLAFRIEKKFAYLSWPTAGTNSERKFEILDVRDIDEPAPTPRHLRKGSQPSRDTAKPPFVVPMVSPGRPE